MNIIRSSLKSLGVAAFAATAFVHSASALLITPATLPQWTGTDNSNLNAAAITAIVGGAALTEVYKMNVGDASDTGSFASSYVTTFSNSAGDPEDALIDYISGAAITSATKFLYVKDGNSDPAFYIFDISAWNGTEDLVLQDFWIGKGAISHVAIYTRGGGGDIPGTPDGGNAVALLGVALAAVALARRKLA